VNPHSILNEAHIRFYIFTLIPIFC
jgi:hypothetical protein